MPPKECRRTFRGGVKDDETLPKCAVIVNSLVTSPRVAPESWETAVLEELDKVLEAVNHINAVSLNKPEPSRSDDLWHVAEESGAASPTSRRNHSTNSYSPTQMFFALSPRSWDALEESSIQLTQVMLAKSDNLSASRHNSARVHPGYANERNCGEVYQSMGFPDCAGPE